MKAIVYTEFGPPDVLHLAEVAAPAPKDNEVLVRVHATPVAYGDLLARNKLSRRNFNMPLPLLLPTRMYFGFTRPKVNILGSEFAGEVAAVGGAVTRFKVGDQVMGYLGQRMGAYAEYICMAEDGSLALKPANMDYAEAAAIPYGAIMATSLLGKANLQAGQTVLVNGASGGIGSAAVQLARHAGAHVTGVCGTPRVPYVQSLGADRVIDYTAEDFTRNGATYDVIFDVLGKCPYDRCKGSLAPEGIYLPVSFKMKAVYQMLWLSLKRSLPGRKPGQRVICAFASEKAEDLVFVKELVEAGKYKVVVDRCYPLAQAAEAHRYVETGNKAGQVILTVA